MNRCPNIKKYTGGGGHHCGKEPQAIILTEKGIGAQGKESKGGGGEGSWII